MSPDKLLKQGIAALKAGHKAEARDLLTQVVEQDERNEMAWLWLSGAVETDEERRICLENVLAINPNNSVAQRGLESLRKKSPKLFSGSRQVETSLWSIREGKPESETSPKALESERERVEETLNQAVAAIRSGEKQKGKCLLIEILEQDEENESAWLWMTRCVDDREIKRECFERVLEINPENENAIKGLKRLETLSQSERLSKGPGLTRQQKLIAGILLLACIALIGVWTGGALSLPADMSKQVLPTATSMADVSSNDASLGDTRIRPIDNAMMVYVPAGEFEMGSTDGGIYEQPVHTVSLDGFWIDKYEVTNAQFVAFLNDNGNLEEGGVTWLNLENEGCLITRSSGGFHPKSGYADHPVVSVSWYGARAYAKWVGGRLPSEAEWEYAARGTDGRIYPWGNKSPTVDLCNFGQNVHGTVPVGTYSPQGDSPYGCADMAGNVYEWTQNIFREYPYAGDAREKIEGESDARFRMTRGGSFYDGIDGTGSTTCTWRGMISPVAHYMDLGFRVASTD
jgi:formylglycine-generating enzyme required for sulfatase activity